MPKKGYIRSEKMKASDKAYAEAHRQERLEAVRRYQKRHPDRCKAQNAKWAKENPDKIRAKSRLRALRYPTLARDRNRKLREEKASRPRPLDGRCEVCGGTQNRALAWDHNHKTEVFRGWLCSGCNSTLGHVKDDIERLEKLITYLKVHNSTITPVPDFF